MSGSIFKRGKDVFVAIRLTTLRYEMEFCLKYESLAFKIQLHSTAAFSANHKLVLPLATSAYLRALIVVITEIQLHEIINYPFCSHNFYTRNME